MTKTGPLSSGPECLIQLKEVFAYLIATCKKTDMNSDKKDVIIDET